MILPEIRSRSYEVMFVSNQRFLKKLLPTEEDVAKNLELLSESGIIVEREKENGTYVINEELVNRLTPRQIAIYRNECYSCGTYIILLISF